MSETINLKLFKHDNPENNTNQFNVDKALNENWDKIDKGIGQDRVTIAELQAENERLKQDLNGLPTGQASGESIDLTDSAEMRFSKFKISGNSKQETREGYNLLDVTKLTDTAKTQDIQVDDEFYVSDSTSKTDSRAWNYTYCNWNNINLKTGTYTIVLLFQNQCTNNGGYMGIYDEYDNVISSELSNHITGVSKYIRTIKLSQDQKIGIEIKGFDGIYRIMLLEGEYTEDTLPDYEQYGASPSVEIPSEVEGCGDNINLIDLDSMVDGYVTTTGEFARQLNQGEKRSDFIKVLPNTSYTFKIHETSQRNNDWIGIGEYSSSDVSTFIQRNVKGANSTSFTEGIEYTITTTATTQYIVVSSRNLKGATKIKLEKGNRATGHSPYGQGRIDEVIDTGNLLKFNDVEETTVNGITYTCKDGIITLNGTCTSATIITFDEAFLINPNTYTLSSNFEGKVNGTVGQYLYDYMSSGNVIFDGGNITWGPTTKTLTSQKKVNYGIWIQSGAVLNNLVLKPQLEFGTTKTQWKKGKSQVFTISTQQPMRSIGDIRDTFIKVDGKWKFERHDVNRYYFTGKENIFLQSINSYGIANFGCIFDELQNSFYSSADKILSNYFKCQTEAIASTKTEGILKSISGSSKIIYFRVDSSNISTVEEFKSWLEEQYNAGKPVYVDYVLETPIDIECTEEQARILDEIDNTVKSYKGGTHIYSTDNVGAYVEVIYRKDLESRLVALESAILN